MRKITHQGDYIEVELTGEQMPEHLELLFAELKQSFPDCEGTPLLVIDRDSDYTGEHMDVLVANLKHGLKDMKTRMAIVVSRDLQYGIGRMASVWTSDDENGMLFMPFRDKDKALEWLKGNTA